MIIFFTDFFHNVLNSFDLLFLKFFNQFTLDIKITELMSGKTLVKRTGSLKEKHPTSLMFYLVDIWCGEYCSVQKIMQGGEWRVVGEKQN
jgi:hypothetical protein